MRVSLSLLFVAFAIGIADTKNYVRVCYHTNWSQYRPGAGKFWPENIDPHLCTHLMYSFAKINRNNDKLAMYEWNDDKLYPRFNALKQKNPELRTLLAVGGWNHENANSPFSKMVKTAASRKVFGLYVLSDLSEIENVVALWPSVHCTGIRRFHKSGEFIFGFC